MVTNNWLLKFLSDILGVTVDRPETIETTALGVAYLAGLQAGIFTSTQELANMWHRERRFEPTLSKDHRNKLYDQWLAAVRKVQS